MSFGAIHVILFTVWNTNCTNMYIMHVSMHMYVHIILDLSIMFWQISGQVMHAVVYAAVLTT